jgi:benzil reductase ((S)-benzoin forming)
MAIARLLITGCTRGIGRALACKFSRLGCLVYAVGRDLSLLDDLSQMSPLIRPIQADIATPEGREALYAQIDQAQSLSIIHNAAILMPGQFDVSDETTLLNHIQTNFIAPLLITQRLLPLLTDHQRILHITSGAASHPISGLLPYCATKAAMQMAIQCLNEELKEKGICCGNLRPGMVDTPMQASLRNAKPEDLPSMQTYRSTSASGQLVSPERAAQFAAWVLLKTDDQAFGETLWSIYDDHHHPYWGTKTGA